MELFDEILILHKGRRVFDGPYEELRPFFGERGIDIPQNCNCIEFLINLINIDRNSVKLLEEQVDAKYRTLYSEEVLDKIDQIIEQENDALIVSVLEQREFKRRSSNINLENIENPIAKLKRQSSRNIQRRRSTAGPMTGNSFNEADFDLLMQDNRNKEQSLFRTIGTLYSRSTTCLLRNSSNFTGRIIQVVINIIVCFVIFFNMGYDAVGRQNREGAMYQFMMMFCFVSIQLMLLVFNENTDLTIKEIEQGLYSPGAYFWNVSLVNAPMNLIMYWTMAITSFFICNLNFENWYNLANFMAIVTTVYFMGDAWGTFISGIAGSAERAVTITPVITQPLAMFAGFILNDKSVPVGLIWLKYISFFRYVYLALIENEFTDIHGCNFPVGPDLCDVPEERNANLGVWWYILILWGE